MSQKLLLTGLKSKIVDIIIKMVELLIEMKERVSELN